MSGRAVRRAFIIFAFALSGSFAAGCGGEGTVIGGAPTATSTRTSTPSSTTTLIPTATQTPCGTCNDVLTPPSRTATSTPSETATPTNSPSASATATITFPPSVTPTITPTDTISPTPTLAFTPGTCGDPSVNDPLCALDDPSTTGSFLGYRLQDGALIKENALFPYPSSIFLAPDETTPTGVRVAYPLAAMPANISGRHIDPTEWNTLDGFSPGAQILALFAEGVDLVASGVAPITDIARSLDDDSPTVIINAATGERVVHFAELDAQATKPETRALIIRPMVRLHEGIRYVVAIRGLKDTSGYPIPPRPAFQILRDGSETPVNAINNQRTHYQGIFGALAAAGVARDDLILAWDFVTASTQSITGRAVSTRDQGLAANLAANPAGAPQFTVTSVEDEYSEHIFRRVRGTFTVPLFMTKAGPGAVYNLDANGNPVQNGTASAPFTVIIPRSAVAGPQAGRALIYGHGLLGSGEGEITAGHLQELADRFNFIVAATDWIGLSENDVGTVAVVLTELSKFPRIADRLQQAFLNFILLGRLMTAENGLNNDDAFKFGGVPIIDPQAVYYYGNSQGGIEGGAYMALSPDTIRGVLGVGAANYSILLQRSIDGVQYEALLNTYYTNELDRAVIYPLLQQLWDRGEPEGYISHLITNPLPGTPAKKILMQIGLHDWQVSNLASEIEARSLGIPNLAPSAWPRFGIPEMTAPFDGSAFVPYDVGGAPEPLTNTPPGTGSDNGVHEAVRRLDAAQRQIDAFLRSNGTVENFCDGPCVFQNVPGVTGP